MCINAVYLTTKRGSMNRILFNEKILYLLDLHDHEPDFRSKENKNLYYSPSSIWERIWESLRTGKFINYFSRTPCPGIFICISSIISKFGWEQNGLRWKKLAETGWFKLNVMQNPTNISYLLVVGDGQCNTVTKIVQIFSAMNSAY